MNIEDFKLNQTQNMENINPFFSFSRQEYEKQMVEEMMLNQNYINMFEDEIKE